MYLIHKVAEEDNENSLRALALAIMIKANFVSSTFKDATATSLMSYFHLKHNTLKKALHKGLEMGLLTHVYRVDKKGIQHKDLKAVKLHANGRCSLKLNIVDTKFGRAVYIHTNHKNLHYKYQNAESFQSINDVMDLLLLSKTLSLFKKHNKIFDCQLRQACLDLYPNSGDKLYAGAAKSLSQYEHLACSIQEEIPVGTINCLNCGYSLDKMLSHFGAFVTRYKLRKLLHSANQQHDYLFHVWENVAYIDQTERIKNHSYKIKPMPKNPTPFELFQVAYENYDLKVEGMRQAYRERFIDADDEGNVINLHDQRGMYIAKNRKRCLAKPMAYTYYMQCDPFVISGKKNKRVKETAAPAKKIMLAKPSVECHCEDANLPY